MQSLRFYKFLISIIFLLISTFAFVTVYANKLVQIGSETAADVITVDPKTDRVNISVGVEINEGIVVITDDYKTHNFFISNGRI